MNSLDRALVIAGMLVVSAGLLSNAQTAATPAPAAQPQPRVEPNKGGQIDLASSDPAVALQRFKLQDGFAINLFASEKEFPELGNAVAIAWDDAGRLWVSTMPSYPHVLPGVHPDDKILVLEDTDRDGRADACMTFADGLYQPTGFEVGDGGVYVGQQPDVMFLKDTDGDGKADWREKILHGFGTEDSHHAVHTFVWGPDGALYFQEGTFFNSQIETPHGTVRLKDAGIYRFEPLSHRLGVFVSYRFANPWGHYFDRWGSNFIADASGGANYFGSAITGRVEFPYKHPNLKVFTSVVRPTAGCEIVSSRHFPEEAQGNFLVNNCIGFQGIKQHRMIEEGSGYTSQEVTPLLESADPNFRPVGLRFGPDGALYIVDWWNPLVGHMQYSLRDERRDQAHGRIWRVTAQGRPLLDPPKIAGATIAEKLDALQAYEDRARYRVRISLREHPAVEVQAELKKWVLALDKKHPTHEHHLLEALWASQSIGEPHLALLKQLLRARDFHVRAGATRAVRFCLDQVPDALALLQPQVSDESPRVRLEALLTLSYVAKPEAAALSLEALKHDVDYYLDYVLKETITVLEPQWKPVLFSDQTFAAANPKGREYLLHRLSNGDLVELSRRAGAESIYQAVLARGGIDLKDRRSVLAALAKAKRTTELTELAAALERAEGDARKDLVQMLAQWEASELAKVRPSIEKLATEEDVAAIRQAAFAALIRADRTPERAWQLAASSKSRLQDLLESTALLKDRQLLAALYPKIQPLFAHDPNAAETAEKSVIGRHVRIEHVAESRTLTLAEVEVFSGSQNIASQGKAKQSSTEFGGEAERAIDGRTEGLFSAGTSSHSREMENYPWWELDLGTAQPIDRITLWNRTDADLGKRLNAAKLTVLDEARQPVFVKESIEAPQASVSYVLGEPDSPGAIRRSAMAALSRIPGHDAAIFSTLAATIARGIDVPAAIAAINRLPKASWPRQADARLSEAIAMHAARIPLDQRDTPAFRQVLELGSVLAKSSPGGEQVLARLQRLAVQSLTIKSVEAQMRYDVTQFYVEAGRPVAITFDNVDIMQHNLIVVKPGAMEEVGKAGEALGADGFAVGFVPKSDKILFASKLLDPRKKEALVFTAPAEPGDYPYVCTFPGHWIIMNGVMTVVPAGDPRAGKIIRANTSAPLK